MTLTLQRGFWVPAESGFDPSSLDLALWLDPRSNVYQEITGLSAATPAASNSDPVGTWRDKLNNGNFVAASSNGTRGSLNTALLNSLRGVQFDGSQFLKGLFTLAQPFTVAIVFRDTSATLGDPIFDGGADFAFVRRYNPISKWDMGTNGNNLNCPGANSEWHALIAVFNGNSSRLVIDNVLLITAVAGDVTGEAPGGFSLAGFHDASAMSNIDIGSPGVFVVRGAMSEIQQENMFAYVAGISGLSLGKRSTIYSGGLGYNAFPDAVRCPNSDILVFFSSGTDHNNPDHILKGARSADNGVSFGAATTILDIGPTFCCPSSVGSVVLANGKILKPFSKEHNTPRVVVGMGMVQLSSNGTVVDEVFYPADLSGYYNCVFYGPLYEETPGGTLLASIWGIKISDNRWASLWCQSVDIGRTWTVRGVIAGNDPTKQWNETYVLYLGGSNYLAAVRNELGKPDIYLSDSSDSGATWSSPNRNIDGVSPALYECSNGNILQFVGDRLTAASTTKQTGIKVRRSTDDGATWDIDTMNRMVYSSSINSIDLGYPAPVSLGGARLGLPFYDESHNIKWLAATEAAFA